MGIVDFWGWDSGMGKYLEFVWMKEKKNIRKNFNLFVLVFMGFDIGNYIFFFILFEFICFNFNKLEMFMIFFMKFDFLMREGYLIRYKILGVGVDFDLWFVSERWFLFFFDIL